MSEICEDMFRYGASVWDGIEMMLPVLVDYDRGFGGLLHIISSLPGQVSLDRRQVFVVSLK